MEASGTAGVAGQAKDAATAGQPDSDASAGGPAGAAAALSLAEAAGAPVTAGATTRALAHAAAGSGAVSLGASLSGLAGGDKPATVTSTVSAAAGVSLDATAGLSQVGTNSALNGSTATVSTPNLQVHASVDSSDFAQGVADRVSWMIGSGVNGAKLQVNPPQLGPIELSISVQGNHALVAMTTHSAVTRDALESSSPKLREMLSAQGFGQVSVDISQRSFQDRSANSRPYEQASSSSRNAAAAAAVPTITGLAPRASVGMLDAYA